MMFFRIFSVWSLPVTQGYLLSVWRSGVPTDLESLSNWALGHLWVWSRCSSGWSWAGLAGGMTEYCRAGIGSVQSTEGSWALMGRQTAPSADWSQHSSGGLRISPSIVILPLVHSAQILSSGPWDSPGSPKMSSVGVMLQGIRILPWHSFPGCF